MQIGTVCWFNSAKGYGFLSQDNGPDLFVHFSAIQQAGFRTLRDGTTVLFNIEAGPDGRPQAANVSVVNTQGNGSPLPQATARPNRAAPPAPRLDNARSLERQATEG